MAYLDEAEPEEIAAAELAPDAAPLPIVDKNGTLHRGRIPVLAGPSTRPVDPEWVLVRHRRGRRGR